MSRCALYHFRDTEGRSLYIGISTNPLQRAGAHGKAKWASCVASCSCEWQETRAAALAAEAAAIVAHAPIWNDIHAARDVARVETVRGASQTTVEGWRQAAADGLTMRQAAARFGKTYAAARKAAQVHGLVFRKERASRLSPLSPRHPAEGVPA